MSKLNTSNKFRFFSIAALLALLTVGSYFFLNSRKLLTEKSSHDASQYLPFFAKYLSYAKTVEAFVPGLEVDTPSLTALTKNPIQSNISFYFELLPKLFFTQSSEFKGSGDSGVIETTVTPQEGTAGYMRIHFENEFLLKATLAFRDLNNAKFKVALNPFSTISQSYGPGVELWAKDGLKLEGEIQKDSFTAELTFKDFGVIFKGLGVRADTGYLKFAEQGTFEAEAVQWIYLNEQGLRKAAILDQVKGTLTFPDKTPRIQASVEKKGQPTLKVAIYTSGKEGQWNIDLDEGKKVLPLREGWLEIYQRCAAENRELSSH